MRNMYFLKKMLIACCTTLILFTSCKTPADVTYFQDLTNGQPNEILNLNTITLLPKDQVSIVVKSRDNQLSNLFNLPIVSSMVGQTYEGSYSGNTGMSNYNIDSEGYIDFPVIGKIKAAGMSRESLGEYIKNELVTKNLVKDPIVTVEYTNLRVSVLGEVKNPGKYIIDRDDFTLIDAISKAGDLTISGLRTNVTVIRTTNGIQTPYVVDLTSNYNLLQSPVYYLQQNDVVYVSPNKMRKRQSTPSGNALESTSFWFSLASLLTTITAILIK